ncbi:MAG: hypothetical protein EP298_04890 [Gammaproteobacteria bacterium]|nr:MAG: hypothetical protein EP298_04890 [Gammaproteobacteria bacterium]UTW42534.1 hypothetical protein KFE69_13865 [bacterium SCSIO 12844]
MKKTLGIVIASLALSSTTAFAGLELSGDASKYNSNTVSVSCKNNVGKVATLPAITNQDVPWFLVQGTFLSGANSGHCTFTYTKTNAYMGEGDVSISGDMQQGKVSDVKQGDGFTVTVAPDQTNYHAKVIISVS